MSTNFDTTQKQSQEAFEIVTKSNEAANKGFQTVAKEAADYTKLSYEAGAKVFEKLAAAKSFDKAAEIQTAYAKSSYEVFVGQATKMTELYTNIIKDAYKPFEAVVAKATSTKPVVAKATSIEAVVAKATSTEAVVAKATSTKPVVAKATSTK